MKGLLSKVFFTNKGDTAELEAKVLSFSYILYKIFQQILTNATNQLYQNSYVS